jgi:hypothetical protein
MRGRKGEEYRDRYEADDLHLLEDKPAMKLSASVKPCTIIGTLTAL